MSVTVSKVYGTYKATADWGGHEHRVSKDDYEVPSWSDYTSLDRRVDRLISDSSSQNDKLEAFTERMDEIVHELSMKEKKLSDKIRESNKKLLEELRAEIQDRGMLSQAYQEVTNKHLLQIEGVSARLHESMEIARVDIENKLKSIIGEERKKLADFAGSLESRMEKIAKEAFDVKKDLSECVQTLSSKREEMAGVLNRFEQVEKSAAGFKADFQDFINKLAPVMKDVETVGKRVDEVRDSAQKCDKLVAGISSSVERRIQDLENACRKKMAAIDALCAEYEKRYLDLTAENESLRNAVMGFSDSSSSFWKRLKWLFTGRHAKDSDVENTEACQC